MNKKQLIVAWAMGILAAALLFFGLGKRISPHLYLLTNERPYWKPTAWSVLAVIIIIGILLIYTLRNKNK